jgi:A/G-specific adenine glycosylase
MLQQTQVDRVLPKYHEWLASIRRSRRSPRRRKRRHRNVAPLGYNIRPRRLQSIARESVRATAASCRRRGDAALVQGHRRLHRRRDSQLRLRQRARSSTPTSRACSSASSSAAATKAHAMRKHLWAVSVLVPRKHVFDFNQALMDFGATCARARAEMRSCSDVRTVSLVPALRRMISDPHVRDLAIAIHLCC